MIIGCEVIECKRFVPLPNWSELMNEGDRTFAQQDTSMEILTYYREN